jgi:hypothetical protein
MIALNVPIATSQPLPRILVVTSCTGEKLYSPKNQLKLADFQDPVRLQKRSEELSAYQVPARQMYTGTQHLQVMEGVEKLRRSFGTQVVNVVIVSAGYGLILENEEIVPYEVTFQNMNNSEIDQWADTLEIHTQLESTISNYDLVFFLLGANYLRSLALPFKSRSDQTFMFLASGSSQQFISVPDSKKFILPLSNAEAKKYSYGLVGLKGFLFKQFALKVAHNPKLLQTVSHQPESLEKILDTQPIQLELSLSLPKVSPQQKQKSKKSKGRYSDGLIPIPNLPPAPNISLGMQYFIPEWDDRVDPNFNFKTDTLTPKRETYEDWYAHQIYPQPNYDGILVSKVVVDKSRKKKNYVEEFGIHKALRYQGEIFGDCGAFGYIKEEKPPYKTEEILDYYTGLGFNYGVSIDHLIVGDFAKPGSREFRFGLTLDNALDFIEKCRERGDEKFTPIGAAQGWNPESYAEAVKELISMGYEYIALGGMARTPSQDIIDVLIKIQPYLKSTTRLHLFGVARLDAIPAFRHLGVTSFDSSGPLRSAWLDPDANYQTITGKTYAAVRIPPVGKNGLRIKQVVDAGISDLEELRKLEQNSLNAIRGYEEGRYSLEETLEVLLAYDYLLELPRNGKVSPVAAERRQRQHAIMYRELLEDQPWKKCDCVICQELGVEVAIFRGNDRNRRRGFHNTYVFYKRFKALIQRLQNKSD